MEQEIVRNSLIESHIPFTKRLVKKMHCKNAWTGIDISELESAAFFGLCDAAWRYNDERSTNFRTFSFLRIQGAIYDTMRREYSHHYSRSSRSVSTDVNPRPARTAAELRDIINVLPDPFLQLHVSPVEDGNALTEMSYINDQNPEQKLQSYRFKRHLHDLIDKLPDKERLIIRLYYFDDLGFDDMRSHFDGATRSWLCRLHRRALGRLKKLICLREGIRAH